MKKLLLFYLLYVSFYCEGQPNNSFTKQMDAIFKEYNKSTPGCAIAVVKNGKVVFEKGYGLASLEYSIPITSKTVFDIASVAKQFTGLAISKLIEQGKISADDDIRKYLPDVPVFGKPITVYNLLHHTSGLRDWPYTLLMSGRTWEDPISFNDIMNMVKHQKYLDFETGTKCSYSNTNYNLLAAIVEKVTGVPFVKWMNDNIFSPLGMTSSHLYDNNNVIIKNLAGSYKLSDTIFVKEISTTLSAYGSSSLFTNITDLCKWVINFQKAYKLNDPVYTRMTPQYSFSNDPKMEHNGKKVDYGYGLMGIDDRGLRTFDHSGGWAGYQSIIAMYPDEDFSVIMLSNTQNFSSTLRKKLRLVVDLFLNGKFETTITKQVSAAVTDFKQLPTISVDTLILKRYTGTYQLRPYHFLNVFLEGKQLMVQATGEGKFVAEAKSDSIFWVDDYNDAISFSKEGTGELRFINFSGFSISKKIIPVLLDIKSLDLYKGIYYSDELGTEFEVDKIDSALVLKHRRHGNWKFYPSPISSNQFINPSKGLINFFMDNNGKVHGFTLSQSRVQNLRFEKRCSKTE